MRSTHGEVVPGTAGKLRPRRFGRLPWALAVAGACSLTVASPVQAQQATPGASPGRSPAILVLVGGDAAAPSTTAFLAGLGSELRAAQPIERVPHTLYLEYLDRIRFADRPAYDADLRDWLRRKYAGLPVDVIVAVSLDGLSFALAARDGLWPAKPVIFGAIDERRLPGVIPAPHVTGSATRMDLVATVNLALGLLPDTRRVALIGGAAPSDVYWTGVARRDLAAFAGRLQLIDLVGLRWEDMLARIRSLPEHTILLGVSFVRDRDGRSIDPLQGARAIAETSNRPFFTPFGTVFGQGSVGGGIVSFEDAGRTTAGLVRRVIGGAPADTIPVARNAGAMTVVDARQLRRWGIPESRVPNGTIIRFPLPSLWRDHREGVIGGISAIVILAGLVAVLLVERRRRRYAEAEARQRLVTIQHMNRSAAMGELSASLAHEMNQPLGAILNNAEAAAFLLAADPPALDAAREAIDAIRSDDQRASDVVRRLRALFTRQELEFRELSPNDLVRHAVELVAAAARERGVSVTLALAPQLPTVRGDAVHLQQVLLNLLLNAMDAMSGASGPHALTVRTRIDDGAIEVAVIDSGPGFRPEVLPHVFTPFYSTKQEGMGMGLSIAQTIVLAHGGRIWAANDERGRGASVCFTVPCAGEAAARATGTVPAPVDQHAVGV